MGEIVLKCSEKSSLVVRILGFHCCGPGSIPGRGINHIALPKRRAMKSGNFYRGPVLWLKQNNLPYHGCLTCIAFHVCNFCDENRGEERKEEGREKGKEERTKAGRHKIKDLLSVPSSGSRWEQLRVPEPLAFSFMRKQWFMPAHSVSIHVSDVIWCWHDLRSETGFKSSLCS